MALIFSTFLCPIWWISCSTPVHVPNLGTAPNPASHLDLRGPSAMFIGYVLWRSSGRSLVWGGAKRLLGDDMSMKPLKIRDQGLSGLNGARRLRGETVSNRQRGELSRNFKAHDANTED